MAEHPDEDGSEQRPTKFNVEGADEICETFIKLFRKTTVGQKLETSERELEDDPDLPRGRRRHKPYYPPRVTPKYLTTELRIHLRSLAKEWIAQYRSGDLTSKELRRRMALEIERSFKSFWALSAFAREELNLDFDDPDRPELEVRKENLAAEEESEKRKRELESKALTIQPVSRKAEKKPLVCQRDDGTRDYHPGYENSMKVTNTGSSDAVRDVDLMKVDEDDLKAGRVFITRVPLINEIRDAITDTRLGLKKWKFQEICDFISESAGFPLYLSYFEKSFYEGEVPAATVAQSICDLNQVPPDFMVGETVKDTLKRGALRDVVLEHLSHLVSHSRAGTMNPNLAQEFAVDTLQFSADFGSALEHFQLLCQSHEIEPSAAAQLAWAEHIDNDFVFEKHVLEEFSDIYLGTRSDDTVPTWTGALYEPPFHCREQFHSLMTKVFDGCRGGKWSIIWADKLVRHFYGRRAPALPDLELWISRTDMTSVDLADKIWHSVPEKDDWDLMLQTHNDVYIKKKMRQMQEDLEKRAKRAQDTIIESYREVGNGAEVLPKLSKLRIMYPNKRRMLDIAEDIINGRTSLRRARKLLKSLETGIDLRALWKKMYQNGLDPVYFYGGEISRAMGYEVFARSPLHGKWDKDHQHDIMRQPLYFPDGAGISDSDGETEGLWGLRMPTEDAKKWARQLKLREDLVEGNHKNLKLKRKEQAVRRFIMGEEPPHTSRGSYHAPMKRTASKELSAIPPKRSKTPSPIPSDGPQNSTEETSVEESEHTLALLTRPVRRSDLSTSSPSLGLGITSSVTAVSGSGEGCIERPIPGHAAHERTSSHPYSPPFSTFSTLLSSLPSSPGFADLTFQDPGHANKPSTASNNSGPSSPRPGRRELAVHPPSLGDNSASPPSPRPGHMQLPTGPAQVRRSPQSHSPPPTPPRAPISEEGQGQLTTRQPEFRPPGPRVSIRRTESSPTKRSQREGTPFPG